MTQKTKPPAYIVVNTKSNKTIKFKYHSKTTKKRNASQIQYGLTPMHFTEVKEWKHPETGKKWYVIYKAKWRR
jgi:hypothetical protein